MISLKLCSDTYKVEKGRVIMLEVSRDANVRYLLCVNELMVEDITDKILSSMVISTTVAGTTVNFELCSGEVFKNIKLEIGTLGR